MSTTTTTTTPTTTPTWASRSVVDSDGDHHHTATIAAENAFDVGLAMADGDAPIVTLAVDCGISLGEAQRLAEAILDAVGRARSDV